MFQKLLNYFYKNADGHDWKIKTTEYLDKYYECKRCNIRKWTDDYNVYFDKNYTILNKISCNEYLMQQIIE